MNHQQDCICRVYELGFALDDLALYLDTHPNCTAGLNMFQTLKSQYEAAVEVYETEVGPLRRNCSATADCWIWADSPAPWEVCD